MILCSVTSAADLSSLIRVSRMFHNVFLGFKSEIFVEVLRNALHPDCMSELHYGYQARSIRTSTDADEPIQSDERPTLQKKDACEMFHFYAAVEDFALDYINRGGLEYLDIQILGNKNAAPRMLFSLFLKKRRLLQRFSRRYANFQVTKPYRLLEGRRRAPWIERLGQLEELAFKVL